MGISIGKSALAAALSATALATGAASAGDVHEKNEATVLIAGVPSGTYREETVRHGSHIEDTVEQLFVFNRVGSRVEMSEKDVYDQDANGQILGGHSEMSSSKTTVAMDYTVHGNTVVLTTHSGGRNYTTEIPVTGPLFGPAGMRRMLLQANVTSPDSRYQTFVPSLGGASQVELKYLGAEPSDGESTRKFSQTIAGAPGAATLWVDAGGYTAQTLMDSPFGPIRIVRGQSGAVTGAQLPAESYENTLAISNIRLPHPRLLQSVSVELTKKPGVDSTWPDMASANQKVLEENADHMVLTITQPQAGEETEAQATVADRAPNALIQSDDPAVIALAARIAGNETDPWKKALLLQSWVAANMQFDTGIAVAPAAELVRDRHGTCMGYSILLASLARAQGIPAHIRMGYVYDSGIWGGHAWTEMLVHGQWLPLDSAEYHPGIADAARIAVTTVEGERGSIEHIADLAQLFGKINVRTLGYTFAGRTVSVARTDADHIVQDDTYNNPWLGLSVRKPAGFTFDKLDVHWPDRGLVTLTAPNAVAHVDHLRADDGPLEKQMSDSLAIAGRAQSVRWNNAPALRVDGANKSAIATLDGDVIWVVVAEGPNSGAVLDQIAPNVAVADLAAR